VAGCLVLVACVFELAPAAPAIADMHKGCGRLCASAAPNAWTKTRSRAVVLFRTAQMQSGPAALSGRQVSPTGPGAGAWVCG